MHAYIRYMLSETTVACELVHSTSDGVCMGPMQACSWSVEGSSVEALRDRHPACRPAGTVTLLEGPSPCLSPCLFFAPRRPDFAREQQAVWELEELSWEVAWPVRPQC